MVMLVYIREKRTRLFEYLFIFVIAYKTVLLNCIPLDCRFTVELQIQLMVVPHFSVETDFHMSKNMRSGFVLLVFDERMRTNNE